MIDAKDEAHKAAAAALKAAQEKELPRISGIQVPVFTILTREPSEEIRFIHDRMPVILPREAVEKWIKPDSKPDEIIKEAMTDMVFEKIIA